MKKKGINKWKRRTEGKRGKNKWTTRWRGIKGKNMERERRGRGWW